MIEKVVNHITENIANSVEKKLEVNNNMKKKVREAEKSPTGIKTEDIKIDLQQLKRWFCNFFAGTVVDSGVFAPVLTFQKLFEDEGVPITSDEVRAPMGVHKRVCN